MHARNERFNQEAWLDAWTELNGQTFRYEITSERGSDYIRTKVLKALLVHEQERSESARANAVAPPQRAELPPEAVDELRALGYGGVGDG